MCSLVGVVTLIASSGSVRVASAKSAAARAVVTEAPTKRAPAAKPEAPPLPTGPVVLNDDRGTANVLAYPKVGGSAYRNELEGLSYGVQLESWW